MLIVISRDQELRFTVHESPDYYRLKVSVFNDDKKTDLIGETWIDLNNLIIPGGGQSDQWHELQFKGKYAGEVRIEMTYYDTRPEDEAVIEKRKEAAEKIQAKNNNNNTTTTTTTTGSSLSGPRQPKQVKRRPLPEDPTGSSSTRPQVPEHPPQASGHAHSTHPRSVSGDYARPSSKHGGQSDVHVPQVHGSSPASHSQAQHPQASYPQASHPQAPYPQVSHPQGSYTQAPYPQTSHPQASHPQAPHPQAPYPQGSYPQAPYPQASYPQAPYPQASHSHRGYDMPDDMPRERASHNNRPPAGSHVPYPEEVRMGSRDQHIDSYDPPYPDTHPAQAEYGDETHQGEHHWQRQPVAQDHYDYPPEPNDIYRQNQYEAPPRQNFHQIASPEHGRYDADQISYGQHSRHSSHAQVNGYGSSPPGLPQVSSEQAPRHQYNTSSTKPDGYRSSHPRQSMGQEEERPSYASMQPTVEDEHEEESVPPPPPVHRSAYSPGSQRSGPPPASYKAYSQEYAPPMSESQDHAVPAPISPAEQDLSHSGISMSSKTTNSAQMRPYPSNPSPNTSSSAMPPSLVAGFDTGGAGAEPPRAMHENHSGRMQVNMPSPTAQIPYPEDAPQYQMPAPPQRSSPGAVEERPMTRKSRSRSPDRRGIPHRKSISPKPVPVEDRELSGMPFSPDSYDTLNPNARRASSGTGEPRPRYETPDRETDSGRQSESQTKEEVGPIIGDDGRIIDPSDHLPSETWAPEPERKTKKPEVIIRFKHPQQSTPHGPRSSPRETGTSHHQTMPTTPDSAGRTGRNRLQKQNGRPQSYGQAPNASPHTPPQPGSGSREYEKQHGHNHQRNYSTPNYGSPQPLRRSASPSPSPYSKSSLYTLENTGPPIPSKVPIAQPVNQNYSGTGMDALTQEMQSIDIGSAGCDSSRPGRRYVPRTAVVSSGYAR